MKQRRRIGLGVVVIGRVYIVNAGPGTAQCMECQTGKVLWTERLEGGESWGSVVMAAGRLYVTSRRGITTVFRPDPEKLYVLAMNDFGGLMILLPTARRSPHCGREETTHRLDPGGGDCAGSDHGPNLVARGDPHARRPGGVDTGLFQSPAADRRPHAETRRGQTGGHGALAGTKSRLKENFEQQLDRPPAGRTCVLGQNFRRTGLPGGRVSLHRPRGLDPGATHAQGLPGDWPRTPVGTYFAFRRSKVRLDPARLREPPCLCPQRRGVGLRLAGSEAVTELSDKHAPALATAWAMSLA